MALFNHFAMCYVLKSNHSSLQTYYSMICLVDIKNGSNPPSTIVLFLPRRAGCPGETCAHAVIFSQGKNSCNSKSWMSISLQLRTVISFCREPFQQGQHPRQASPGILLLSLLLWWCRHLFSTAFSPAGTLHHVQCFLSKNYFNRN